MDFMSFYLTLITEGLNEEIELFDIERSTLHYVMNFCKYFILYICKDVLKLPTWGCVFG